VYDKPAARQFIRGALQGGTFAIQHEDARAALGEQRR
jgi:hypothetical protein